MDFYGQAARFHGIYASTVCPMTADGAISYGDLESHIGEVAGCEGLKGLLINGHAGENAMLERDEAREIVYGMPYKDWQAKHQKEATAEQKAAFDKSKPHGH